jgi:AcrR family transcriptional regulator
MNRDEILEAAASIFSQKGYHAASMQDIAAAVSLQKASLYHHFSSKQEILLELLDQALDILIDRLLVVVEQPLPPEVKLRAAIDSYLEALTEHRQLAALARSDPGRDRVWNIRLRGSCDGGSSDSRSYELDNHLVSPGGSPYRK